MNIKLLRSGLDPLIQYEDPKLNADSEIMDHKEEFICIKSTDTAITFRVGLRVAESNCLSESSARNKREHRAITSLAGNKNKWLANEGEAWRVRNSISHVFSPL